MPRRKHIKIAEVRTFENVFDYKQENVEQHIINYLGSDKPVTLELGCGQADYSINLAKLYPHRNFIGVDRKAARLWNASKNANSEKLKNVAFLIAYIEKLNEIFQRIKAEEIWITFPDPYPRRSSIKKRLVHPRFLEVYKNILLPEGKIFLKTDDDTLYAYTLKVIEEEKLILHKSTDDLYKSDLLSEEEKIQTKYEKQHLAEGKKIKLVCFSFNDIA
ncbi:tRNA (guanosine(46)-N7)-methyltransferase TrmB [Rosettibacter firmus]|uniref:tRNA (guanosine(46)-N7)-methyltransferase TrmB n=1 Tax=Rosettibacter firmus TaxID=3111522 RepID=UPI00336BB19A